MRPTLARYAVLLLLASVSGAHAAALIGEAKAVLPAAESQGESGKITLKLGSSLFQDDVVRTASDGKVGLEFLDNTTLEISSNSSVKLDKFIFNPDRTAAEVSVGLAKGVFRFISGGKSKANTYTLVTPHSTLAIRGTELRIDVLDNLTRIKVSHGEVEGCSRLGVCQTFAPGTPVNAGTFGADGSVNGFSDSTPTRTLLAGVPGAGTLAANNAGGNGGAGGSGGSGGSVLPVDLSNLSLGSGISPVDLTLNTNNAVAVGPLSGGGGGIPTSNTIPCSVSPALLGRVC
jgi:hypothetical protein